MYSDNYKLQYRITAVIIEEGAKCSGARERKTSQWQRTGQGRTPQDCPFDKHTKIRDDLKLKGKFLLFFV